MGLILSISGGARPATSTASSKARNPLLLSYGNEVADNYRRAAGFVDRILKGEKPSELPIEFLVKFELAVNLKTARNFGLDIPATMLATADEVIE
jgi:putative tryptophan/tyrosine transport system substrate-binding protein